VAVLDHATQPITLASPSGPTASAPLTIVTVDAVAATIEMKRRLAARTGSELVDMETFAVAEVAAAAGLPCAAVRVISDDARETLPGERFNPFNDARVRRAARLRLLRAR
jgi:nucleoside phosphorylase